MPSCCSNSCCWSVASCGRCIPLQLRAMGRGLGMGTGTLGPAFVIWDQRVHLPWSYNICVCTHSNTKEARHANTCQVSADQTSLSTRFDVVELSCPLYRLHHTVGTISFNLFFWHPKKKCEENVGMYCHQRAVCSMSC